MRIARWRAAFALGLAASSFWLVWLMPLAVCLGLGHVFAVLYGLSPAEVARWGPGWEIAFVLSGSLCLGGGLWFVVFSIRIAKIWQPTTMLVSPPRGVLVSESEAPGLIPLIAKLRAQLGVSGFHEVWIDQSADVTFAEYAGAETAAPVEAVVIGLPALMALSAEQFESLAAVRMGYLTVPTRLQRLTGWVRSMAWRFPPWREAYQYYMGPRWNPFAVCVAACDWAFSIARDYVARLVDDIGCDSGEALGAAQRIHGEFQQYWAEHVQLLLQTGHLVPIAEGFREFWGTSQTERSAGSAISLLRNDSAIEGKLTALMARLNPPLEAISWDQAATVLLDHWRNQVDPKKDELLKVTAEEIHGLLGKDGPAFARRVFQEPGRLFDPNQLRRMTEHLLGCALAVALHRDGRRFVYSGPGTKVAFESGGRTVNPFELLRELANPGMERDAWLATCSELGIAGLRMS
jgi:hypothetical protein